MFTVKLNEDWTATIDGNIVTVLSNTTRIEMGCNHEKHTNYIRIQASHIGSTIGNIMNIDDPPMAPFVLVEVKE